MSVFVRVVLRLAACIALLSPFVCQALAAPAVANATPMEAAGKLRGLAQRQAKLYLQVRLSVETDASRRALAESVLSFDENLGVVMRAAQAEGGVSARLANRIATHWEGLRQILTQPMETQKALVVSQDAEQIALTAQALAVRFDLAQESPLYRLVDLASRNDMLAQRLARVYMQIRAGQGGKASEVDMEQTRREFSAGLKELVASEGNTPAMRATLELARQQWLFFELAVNEREKSSETSRRDVATTSERISQVMSEIGLGYAQMATRPSEVSAARKR